MAPIASDQTRPDGIPASRIRPVHVLVWAVFLGIFVYLGWRIHQDWDATRTLAFRGEWADVAFGIGLSFAAVAAMPANWILLLRQFRLYSPEYRLFYVRLWIHCFFCRYVPGKVMLLFERIRLGRMVGLDPATSAVLVLWETLLGLTAAVMVAAALLFLSAAPDLKLGASLLATVAAIALAGFALPLLLPLATALPWIGPRFELAARLRLPSLGHVRMILAYGAMWLVMATSFFFVCRWFVALPMDALPTVAFWFIASYVGGIVVTAAPGGLGVREGILALGLVELVSPGQAAALAIAGRIVLTLVEVTYLGAVLFVRRPETPTDSDPAAASAGQPHQGAACR